MVGSITTATVVTPFDVAKVRMQLAGAPLRILRAPTTATEVPQAACDGSALKSQRLVDYIAQDRKVGHEKPAGV